MINPRLHSGIFYELPEPQAEIITTLFGNTDQYCERLRRTVVLEHDGKRYLAASDGTMALYWPCADEMPCGAYRGVPYMCHDDESKMLSNLAGHLDKATGLLSYTANFLLDLDDPEILPAYFADYDSRASIESIPCFVGRIEGESFVITDTQPYTRKQDWLFNAKKLSFIMDSLGGIERVKVSTWDKSAYFYHYNGYISILMGMRPLNKPVIFKT